MYHDWSKFFTVSTGLLSDYDFLFSWWFLCGPIMNTAIKARGGNHCIPLVSNRMVEWQDFTLSQKQKQKCCSLLVDLNPNAQWWTSFSVLIIPLVIFEVSYFKYCWLLLYVRLSFLIVHFFFFFYSKVLFIKVKNEPFFMLSS